MTRRRILVAVIVLGVTLVGSCLSAVADTSFNELTAIYWYIVSEVTGLDMALSIEGTVKHNTNVYMVARNGYEITQWMFHEQQHPQGGPGLAWTIRNRWSHKGLHGSLEMATGTNVNTSESWVPTCFWDIARAPGYPGGYYTIQHRPTGMYLSVDVDNYDPRANGANVILDEWEDMKSQVWIFVVAKTDRD